MPIEDLARSDVVTKEADAELTAIAATMADLGVGSVLVTEAGAPTGIVTDRDLVVQGIAEGADLEGVTARDVMSDDLVTIERGAGFFEATELMSEHGVRRLPVTEGEELVGIITLDDLTELLGDEQHQIAEVSRNQRPPYFE